MQFETNESKDSFEDGSIIKSSTANDGVKKKEKKKKQLSLIGLAVM